MNRLVPSAGVLAVVITFYLPVSALGQEQPPTGSGASALPAASTAQPAASTAQPAASTALPAASTAPPAASTAPPAASSTPRVAPATASASPDSPAPPEHKSAAYGRGLLETSPEREVLIHGFRAPSMGVEVRHRWLGFHLGVYPSILGADEPTTWFTKVGLTAYFLSFDIGSGRKSGFYAGASLLQGLSGRYDVTKDVGAGTAVGAEAGFRWAVYSGLDVRLGIAVLVTFKGEVFVNPTPGVSWSIPLEGGHTPR